MPEYRISLETVANLTVTIDADSEDDAIDRVSEIFPGLCPSCTGDSDRGYYLEIGEFDIKKVS